MSLSNHFRINSFVFNITSTISSIISSSLSSLAKFGNICPEQSVSNQLMPSRRLSFIEQDEGADNLKLTDIMGVNKTLSHPCRRSISFELSSDESKVLSPGWEITLIICITLMIIATIVGNMLVCFSVVLVRKLRSPSNYLLISLAISDLCVAVLVMPLALNLELKGYWNLGPTLCDMWISFDVTSCTASILNLCMISVDRYLTITKPLTYGVKRTTKRMLLFISAVWVTSCLIIVPPLLILGNEHGTEEEPKCQVSQNIGYQLYATLASFYIPLVVMIIVYYKIYISAKHVLDAELKSLAPTSTKYFNPIKPLLASSPDSDLESGNRELLKARLNYCEEGSGQRWINLENNNSKFDKEVKRVQPSDTYSKNGLIVKSGDSMISKPSYLHISISPSYKKVKDTLIPLKSQSNKKKCGVNDASNKEMYSRTLVNNVMCINEKGRTSLMIKERKASITLGVIMTAFTVCWLPFFILALLRPFSQTINDIPHWISSFAFWLGLANSMLNPIIYVTFHHDFRQAFRYLLCLQCSTMDLRLREEAYQSQYGMESRGIIKNKTSASRVYEEGRQNRL